MKRYIKATKQNRGTSRKSLNSILPYYKGASRKETGKFISEQLQVIDTSSQLNKYKPIPTLSMLREPAIAVVLRLPQNYCFLE